ncbi:MAG TPA: hypothetical protein VMN03_05105 [Burkholderiales bacterium]|nr:hypothetical protein [Burkholderiales bacterium]
MGPRTAAGTRKLPVTGFAVLLVLAGSGFVSGDASQPVVVAARAAEQDAHVIHYQQHIARLQMIHFTCR